MVTSCVEIVFGNTLLKEKYKVGLKRRKDKEKDLSNCWTTLRKMRGGWSLEEKALGCTLQRTRFGRG